ncbi:hypothetical protein [Devosia nitrariae]|uniref:hypothetical protein n=1 Tax=Devosia nitrariae TaxID=2071872 RepID=UPI0024E19422|nr:hypothetical protein [Devosia nitrariae]
MAGTKRRRFPWIVYVLVLVLILAFALSPVASVAIAGWLAEANGCDLDEGSIHVCMIGDGDWGPTLYTMFVMGWFMLATLPMGAMGLAIWLLVLVAHYLVWRRRQRVA